MRGGWSIFTNFSRNGMQRAQDAWPSAFLGLALAFSFSSAAWATPSDCTDGAMDSGGYACAVLGSDSIPDISPSAGGSGVPISWKISNCNGTVGDDCFESINLNGTFSFYGVDHTIAYVGSNGYLSFGTGYTEPVGSLTIPASGIPNNAIFAYGDDLDPSSGGQVYVSTSGTCTGERNGHTCVIVQWTDVAHYDFPGAQITVQLALDMITNESIVEIEKEDGLFGSASSLPQVLGTENSNGSAGLWYKSGSDPDSGAATAGTDLIFAAGDTTPPGDIAKFSTASRSQVVTLEWLNPTDFDFAGVLVLRRLGSPVNATPTDSVTYSVGDTIGSNTVTCVTTSVDTSCVDSTVFDGNDYYFKAFAYDTFHNYASGIEVRSLPRSTKNFKWAVATSASSLAPTGTVAGQYVLAVGNDYLLHRLNETDGTRGGWDPPNAGSAIQSRPMAGDLNMGVGIADYTSYTTTQDGLVFRHSLDDGVVDGFADAVNDAGCAAGSLQGGPVAMLDAIDGNANDLDDVVIVATRCGASDNRILMYSHDLGTLFDSYGGDEDGDGTGNTLGMSNAAPFILYRDTALNLVYVPLRQDGDDNESLVVLAVGENLGSPEFVSPVYSEIVGVGDVDAIPVAFPFGGSTSDIRLVFGNRDGEIYLYDAVNRTGGPASPLVYKDMQATADGAVRGVAVSGPINDGAGGKEHWVVWSTDTMVHGIKIPNGAADLDGTTHWSINITGPSTPLVLRYVGGIDNVRAFVGDSAGVLHDIDVTTGSTIRTYQVEAGTTLGAPTFDYNDGTNQGVVVGTSSGMIHWVKIK